MITTILYHKTVYRKDRASARNQEVYSRRQPLYSFKGIYNFMSEYTPSPKKLIFNNIKILDCVPDS